MKRILQFIISIGMLFIFIRANSQSTKDFSTGWSEGYKYGYCDYNLVHHKMKPVFIVPISPIAPIGYKTYQEGYRLGVIEGKRDFLKQCNDCENDTAGNTQYIDQEGGSFDDGWKTGYEDGYCDFNLSHHKMKPIFIVPISPIAPIGYKTYQEGYRLGVIEGKRDFLKQCNDCKNDTGGNTQYIDQESGSFDDGWKTGYEDGYCDFNLSHHKMKPIFIVPITPIAPIGYNEYKHGYRMGFKKGKEDFGSK